MLIFIGINAVHPIIAGHNRLGFSLFYRNLKAGEIDFPKGPLIQNRTHGHSSGLLAVHGKVLYAGIDPLTLDSSGIGSRHLSGKVRIFRKILKISSAKRTSLDI